MFWSSVELTGNPTQDPAPGDPLGFWSSVELTGNPTGLEDLQRADRFGAVSN